MKNLFVLLFATTSFMSVNASAITKACWDSIEAVSSTQGSYVAKQLSLYNEKLSASDREELQKEILKAYTAKEAARTKAYNTCK